MLTVFGCCSQAFAQSVKDGKTCNNKCVEQKCTTTDGNRKGKCCTEKKVDGTTSSTGKAYRKKTSGGKNGVTRTSCKASCSSCKNCGCSNGKCNTEKCTCDKCPAKAKRTSNK